MKRFGFALTLMLIQVWASAQTLLSQSANRSVEMVFAGDTTLDSSAGEFIRRGHDPLASFARLFAKADIRVVNLECVVAAKGQALDKHYTFRAHPRVLRVLQKHVDAVTLANNHSGDFGREAFAEMLGLLAQMYL